MFCDHPTGSHEHAWPRWLQQWWNPERKQVDVRLATGTILPNSNWDVGKVNRTCTPCNNWLGVKFEDRAAPLIRKLDTGTPHVLTAGEQRLLASWVYKTTLMLECMKPEGSQVVGAEYRRFRRAGEPPLDCSIIIGATDYPALVYKRDVVVIERNPNGEPVRWMYLALAVVGHIVFHIIGDTRTTNLHQQIAPALVGAVTHQIWPLSGGFLRWPFPGVFTKDALTDMARWGGTTFAFLPDI